MSNPYDVFDAQAALPPQGAPKAQPSNPYDAFDPQQTPYKVDPSNSPLEGMSSTERYVAGIGGALKHSLWEGPRQALYSGLAQLNPGDPSWAANAKKIGDQYAAERGTDAPLDADKYGALGNITGNIAATAPLMGGGALAGIAAGAGLGAMQPVGSDEGGNQRLVNALTGGAFSAVGTGAGKLLAKAANPIANALSETSQKYVNTLQNAGIPLDIAQRTGSEMLQRIKSGLSSLPVTAGWAKESADNQANKFTAAALRTIGADGEKATPEVMGAAKKRIGSVFNDVAERNQIQFDTGLAGDIQGIQADLARKVPESSHGPINSQISDLFKNAQENGGVIDGKVFQRVQSDLGDMTRNADYGTIAGDLRRSLTNALQRSASPEDVALLQSARGQYRNLKQLETAVRDEKISPRILANTLRRKTNVNQSVYGMGDQELPDLAKAGAKILPETSGNSGTADRHASLAMIGAPAAVAAPLLYSAGHSLLSGEPLEADHLKQAGMTSAGILAAVLAAKGAKGLFNSPMMSDYLSHGLGGAQNASAFSKAGRYALELPENNKQLAHALRMGAASYMLLPGTAQQ